MISINRRKKRLKELEKTSSEFKKKTAGMSLEDTYDFYKKHCRQFRYNTEETKQEFKTMNQGRCSFCTKYISEFDTEMTVEHIRVKRDYPRKIYEWGNLLCSCHTCNTKRNVKSYSKEKYLDPTKVEGIEKYFLFELDGEIVPNGKLPAEEQEKAQYMIDIYDLNRETLVNERRDFMNKLIVDEQLYKSLKQLDSDDQSIIYLSVFTYYKGVYK